MKIRNFEQNDLSELVRIVEQYRDQFNLDEFKQDFKCFFTVTDDEDNIVTIGGVRLIPEIVIVTDQTKNKKLRSKAVRLIDQAIKFVSRRAGIRQLHAFIQEESWLQVLFRNGYRPTKGIGIVTDLD